jgi:hypothetical protein
MSLTTSLAAFYVAAHFQTAQKESRVKRKLTSRGLAEREGDRVG